MSQVGLVSVNTSVHHGDLDARPFRPGPQGRSLEDDQRPFQRLVELR